MAKGRAISNDGGNGGIGGSGIFGLLGTTVQCEADDKSWYCKFARLMNVIVWLIMLFALFYFAKEFLMKKK